MRYIRPLQGNYDVLTCSATDKFK